MSGEHRVAEALRDALATRAHAQMCFELVAAELGDCAVLQSWNGGRTRHLHRRESEGGALFPFPVAEFRSEADLVIDVGPLFGLEPAPPLAPRPGRAPRIRNLGPGRIVLHDGPCELSVGYADDGRRKETTRAGPPETLEGLLAALAARDASPAEIVARHVASLDLARHGPGRMHLPAPLPGALGGHWQRGLVALRHAVYTGRIPWTAKWAVADGFSGRALVWGATRDEAFAAWRAKVERVRPAPGGRNEWPPPLPAPGPPGERADEPPAWTPDEDPDASWRPAAEAAASRGPDGEFAPPSPATTPASIVSLPELPPAPPPVGEWVRLLGRGGATHLAALVRDDAGTTIWGDRLLERFSAPELSRIDRDIAASADALRRLLQRPPDAVLGEPRPGAPAPDSEFAVWEVVDPATFARVPPKPRSSARTTGFRPHLLDVDGFRTMVVRQRWL